MSFGFGSLGRKSLVILYTDALFTSTINSKIEYNSVSSGARGMAPGPSGPGPTGAGAIGAGAKKRSRGHGPTGAGAKKLSWGLGLAGAGAKNG